MTRAQLLAQVLLSPRATVLEAYREMELHQAGDVARALFAWRCALRCWRSNPDFADEHLELYDAGLQSLELIAERCGGGPHATEAADALAEAVLFRAQLEVRGQ